MPKKSPPPPAAPPPRRPYWTPSGVALADLPEPVRVGYETIVLPAYDEFVVGAADVMERTVGVSLVHLLELEVLGQIQIGHRGDLTAVMNGRGDDERDRLIAQHLRLVTHKQRAAEFLVKIRQYRFQRGPLAWSDNDGKQSAN
jgi:hypothetical protein